MNKLIVQDLLFIFFFAAVYAVLFSDAVALIAIGSALFGMAWTGFQQHRHRNWHPSTEEYTYRRGARRG